MTSESGVESCLNCAINDSVVSITMRYIRPMRLAFIWEDCFSWRDYRRFLFRNLNSWHFCQVCFSWIVVRSCSFLPSDGFLTRHLLNDLMFVILYSVEDLFFVRQELQPLIDCCLCFFSLLLIAFDGNVGFADDRALLSGSFNCNRYPTCVDDSGALREWFIKSLKVLLTLFYLIHSSHNIQSLAVGVCRDWWLLLIGLMK